MNKIGQLLPLFLWLALNEMGEKRKKNRKHH
jgi:hypothetical protein